MFWKVKERQDLRALEKIKMNCEEKNKGRTKKRGKEKRTTNK